MLNASGMQLIFLPKSPKINRRVWKLLNVAECVQGGAGEGQLSLSKLETISRGEGRCKTMGGNWSSQSGCRRTGRVPSWPDHSHRMVLKLVGGSRPYLSCFR